MVDLPEAERPVSQIVRPCCLRSEVRSARVRALAWKVMLLGFVSIIQLVLAVLLLFTHVDIFENCV
jgi:hypothetical protein